MGEAAGVDQGAGCAAPHRQLTSVSDECCLWRAAGYEEHVPITAEEVEERKQKVEEEYRLALSGHASACRDCVAWAEAASCYAEYERGMARLLERYATALRAAAYLSSSLAMPRSYSA